jgi:hypothetical protein
MDDGGAVRLTGNFIHPDRRRFPSITPFRAFTELKPITVSIRRHAVGSDVEACWYCLFGLDSYQCSIL